MSEYRLTAGSSVQRLSDGASIPDDPANSDRVAYQAWLAAGGVPDPAQSDETQAAPTVAEKLASVGLTFEDVLAAAPFDAGATPG